MEKVPYPKHLNVVTADRDILEGYSSDAIFQAMPNALARPKSVKELQALLAFCHQQNIAATPCGSQTSVTGASVGEGLVVSMEHLSKAWKLYEDPQKAGRWLVEARPAILLGDLQDVLEERGYFYPPDPTSRKSVQLGSTIATNASGEDSYKYGSTRRWVRGLSYIAADGSHHRAERHLDEVGSGAKNTCGYALQGSEIDLIIGSEGTLGFITEVTLEVLPFVPKFFAILFFLPSEESALAETLFLHNSSDFDLRCLEYMDEGAVRILHQKGIPVPKQAKTALYVKHEFDSEDDEEAKMEHWVNYLETLYQKLDCEALMEAVHLARDSGDQARLREWRHHIPATNNELAAQFQKHGGGKVGTDWYVPLDQLKGMFTEVRQDVEEMLCVVFGHIGNGHPHFNFLAKNAHEYKRARQLLLKHCALAVSCGGGVSGEHGLGKLKSHLLAVQFSEDEINEMMKIKKKMDPKGILAPGNIFGDRL